MIVINNNIEQECLAFLYCPADQYIGQIRNVMALMDARRQIREAGKGGYYIKWYEHIDSKVIYTIRIDANGKMDRRPLGFFDKMDDLLDSLI